MSFFVKKINIVFFIFYLSVNAQEKELNKIIVALKEYNIEKASLINNKLPIYYKELFNKKINFLKTGVKLDTIFSNQITNNDRYTILKELQIGDYYYENFKYTQSFNNYIKAKDLSVKLKDTLLINYSLIKLSLLQIKLNNSVLLTKFNNELNKFKKDSVDYFWFNYNETYIKILNNFEKKLNIKQNIKITFQKFNFNIYLKSKQDIMKAFYYEVFLNDYSKSKSTYLNILNNINNYDYFFTNRDKKGIKLNLSILDFKFKKYNQAIPKFKNLLNNEFKKDKDLSWKINQWIYKCYDSLNKIDSAYFYIKKTNKLIKEIDKRGNSLKILNNYKNIELQLKQTQLKNQRNKTNTLKTKMNTILPILAIITLLLGIVFILYKKYHKKTEVLEEEKSETLIKIDELKQIVIKNHIILKDKTKVYIADLTYIKSDDHYLKVFLSNGKNHFVRGKLNKIIEELPPNFIRCHRSYVVNRNFIKQINNTNIILVDKTELPLSRSYKDKL